MCLAVPGLIVELLQPRAGLQYAAVEFSGVIREVCVACVPDVRLGDFVLVHAGIALSQLDTDEADRLIEELKAIGESYEPDHLRTGYHH